MLRKISSILFILIASVIILTYGQHLLTPIIFAGLIWFLIRKVRLVLDKSKFIKKHLPSWVKNVVTTSILFGILVVIANSLSSSVQQIIEYFPFYEKNMVKVNAIINHSLHINLTEIIKENTADLNFGKILTSSIDSITYILGNAFMIVLYTLFIFLEETYIFAKLKALFPTERKYIKALYLLGKIEKSISDYIGLKTLMSVIIAVVCYFALLFSGVHSASFWAILIFLFNYIPTFGALGGTLLPAIFTLFQFGDFSHFTIVLSIVGGIHLLVINFLEPKIMGNSLNLSVLATFLTLSFWGVLWGILGMIVSIPITVIVLIICSHFNRTKPIAILLSEKGVI